MLAAWTVTIKFLFPIGYALAYGLPVGTYIYWDFWWVVHLWLAWVLLRWRAYTWWLALGVSIAEILIVVTKLALFLAAPEWTIWSTNWFVNKLFVLLCFGLMLPYLVLNRRQLREAAAAARVSPGRSGSAAQSAASDGQTSAKRSKTVGI